MHGANEGCSVLGAIAMGSLAAIRDLFFLLGMIGVVVSLVVMAVMICVIVVVFRLIGRVVMVMV